MPTKLVVLAGPDEGRTFTLGEEPVLLGRSRATESHLIDPHVSRVHCQINPEDGQFVLTDFDSAGGTFVNGKKASRHALQPGDIVRIGNTRMQVFADTDAAAPAAPAVTPEGLPIAQPIGLPRTSNWAQELPGQKISHYKVGSVLARSKSGYVFHARDTRRNSAIALKVLDPAVTHNSAAVKRFVKAMQSVLPLRHPNLVRVYGAGKTGPNCWVAMEYVHGENLAAVIGRVETGGMLDWRHVLRVGIFLARGLAYAHEKGLTHQSVTPQNILVGKTMTETKLVDMMLAGAVEGDPTAPISAAGVPSEELSYLPPERTDGPGAPVDARADVYSLGATMYAMLTGHPPFRASTSADLIDMIRLDAPASLKTQKLGLPDPLEQSCRKMLAKRPQDRPASAKDLVKGFEDIAKGHSVQL